MSTKPMPPFAPQQQSHPALSSRMDPKPDIGAESYRGSGKLRGKRALITGGDSGIGAAVAVAFAREGADVAILYLPEEQEDADEVAVELKAAGVKYLLLPGDIRDDAYLEQAVATVAERFDGIDTVVSNAAHQTYLPQFEDITMELWRKHFDINVHSAFNLIRLCHPHLKENSTITVTSSVNSKIARPPVLLYDATKGALCTMVIGLAQLLAKSGIRVNAVLPGPIWAPMNVCGLEPSFTETLGVQVPMGRPGQPSELASAYVMLASDEASYTTGAMITIAGGMPIA